MNERYQVHTELLPNGIAYRIYDARTWYEFDDRDFDPGAQTVPKRLYWNETVARNLCAELNQRYQRVCDDWIAENEPEVGHYGE